MTIGIDGRLIHETGVGRYIRNLIRELGKIDRKNRYILYLLDSDFASFSLPNSRWTKRKADIRWHTLEEQVVLPWIFLRDRLDLLHIPYFSIPILYPRPFVVTIHDLIPLTHATGKATMLPLILYRIRWAAYVLMLQIGLRRARMILVPSRATKNEIMKHFPIVEPKIRVTYEGVDDSISNIKYQISNIKSSVNEHKQKPTTHNLQPTTHSNPYFLYVGNAYPHKNLETVIDAFGVFIKTHPAYRLVLVGPNDRFYERIRAYVGQSGMKKFVQFRESPDDQELLNLYRHACALIAPSIMEGFGLPGLEAVSLGTRVIASDIPVFHEILGSLAHYVNPNDTHAFVHAFVHMAQKKSVLRMTHADRERLTQFSWERMGRETLQVYENSARV